MLVVTLSASRSKSTIYSVVQVFFIVVSSTFNQKLDYLHGGQVSRSGQRTNGTVGGRGQRLVGLRLVTYAANAILMRSAICANSSIVARLALVGLSSLTLLIGTR